MGKLNAKIQKELLAIALNKHFGVDNVICKQNGNTEVDFEWGNIKKETKDIYNNIYQALCDYRGNNEFSKPGKIKCDFVVGIETNKIIIEYDEEQHFTKAREITFSYYPEGIKIYFNKNTWITLCNKLNRHDNNPIYRDEQRAFRDAIRDIESYKNGYVLFRVYNGQYDFSNETDVNKFFNDLHNVISK